METIIIFMNFAQGSGDIGEDLKNINKAELNKHCSEIAKWVILVTMPNPSQHRELHNSILSCF